MGKARTAEEKENPIAPFVPRKYICSRWPFLRLRGGIRFEVGHFTATTEEQAEVVESNNAFPGQIIRIHERKTKQPSIEEAAEITALQELQKLQPQARRGMIGTRAQE